MTEDPYPTWPWARSEAEQCTADDDGALDGTPTRCDLDARHDGPHASLYVWGDGPGQAPDDGSRP